MQKFNITTSNVRDTFAEDFELDERFSQADATRMSCVIYETTFKKATSLSCFFNLTNTIIGSGMLGLPYAYTASGWIVGTMLLVFSGLAGVFSLHLLAMCALKIGGPSSFYSVASRALPAFTLVIDAAVAINCFGVGTSYLIVIGDLMPLVLQQMGGSLASQSRYLWVGLGFAIVVPLCLLRNLDSLKFTSSMSVTFVCFLTLLIVLYTADIPGFDPCASVADGDVCTGKTTVAVVNIHTFQVLSIFVFCYTCQQNVFAITNEMERPTTSRINMVIFGAIGISFTIYMIVAACGYKTYGDLVDPDILVNYPNSYVTSVARLFVSFLVCFSYPLECHPARRSILSLLHHFDNYRYGKTDEQVNPTATISPMQQENGNVQHVEGSVSSANSVNSVNSVNISKVPVGNMRKTLTVSLGHELTEDEQRIRYTYVTCGFLCLSLLIAMSVSNLGTVLAIVGATGSTTVSYILPGFFYYYIFKEEDGPVWKRNLALVMGVTGILIMPVFLIFIFI